MIGPILGGSPRASFDSAKATFTIDGNSISAGSDLTSQLVALAPISNKLTIKNRAISGQTTRDMINSPTDVNNSYESGKRNYLLVWELTNSIHNDDGRTGPETIADTIEYINARQAWVAANRPGQPPWVVILMTGIPRGGNLHAVTADEGEARMQYCNAYIRANYKSMGAIAYVETRQPGGPFDFTDVTNSARFPTSLWSDKTHPNSAGKAFLARYIADVLKRLPAR